MVGFIFNRVNAQFVRQFLVNLWCFRRKLLTKQVLTRLAICLAIVVVALFIYIHNSLVRERFNAVQHYVNAVADQEAIIGNLFKNDKTACPSIVAARDKLVGDVAKLSQAINVVHSVYGMNGQTYELLTKQVDGAGVYIKAVQAALKYCPAVKEGD